MQKARWLLAGLVLLSTVNCTTASTSNRVPDRLASCGAIGNKGLQLFEVCGLLAPADKMPNEISTSECGIIRLTRSERAHLCEGIQTLYGNLPSLDRAQKISLPDPDGPMQAYDE